MRGIRGAQRIWLGIGVVALLVACCSSDEGRTPEVDAIFHLADALDRAEVECPDPPAAREPLRWSFAEPRPEWRPVASEHSPRLATLRTEPLADALRLTLDRPPERRGRFLLAGLAVDLRDQRLADWEQVRVRARAKERLAGIAVGVNLEEEHAIPGDAVFFAGADEAAPIFSDGSVQTYALPLPARGRGEGDRPLRSLGIFAAAPAPASLDLLSVELVPRGAFFAEPCGVGELTRDGATRWTLWARVPARIRYRVALDRPTRLDLGLSTLPGEEVTVRISAARTGSDPVTLLEERGAGASSWLQRMVDLGPFAGQTIDLTLAVESATPGAVALFGSPILSVVRSRDSSTEQGGAARPNVILYVIDGGGADLMSVYGYPRRTTPFLERLAAEGALFERAYSNSTWTQPSTASFMTSLHHSVLGGLRRGVHSTPVPERATTLTERLRSAGYETAVFTSNPNAGRMLGLGRRVDLMQDHRTEHPSTSSAELHEFFFRFRELYPGTPYFVHFQTTDVHEPNEPPAPFAGLYVAPRERQQLVEWEKLLWQAAGPLFGTTSLVDFYEQGLARAGIDRQTYFNLRRGLYDETMAFQDAELAKFVARLKAAGEWENTIFIVAADHGHPAGTYARFGRGLFEPQPEPWQGALFDSYTTRVPLLIVWPTKILGGQRFDRPVSMIDVLPTILELAGLPAAKIAQGQSLAPLLLGGTIEPRPVVLDEFRVDEATGEMVGNLEIIDGRWGASLEIGPQPAGADPAKGRHAVPAGGRWGAVHPYFPEVPRLLLYDLSNDPFARHAVNDEHPELVDRYERELRALWQAHQALATQFREASAAPLDPEQLRQLEALGYIR